MEAKKWYKSRTVWSGILKIVAGVTTSLSGLLVGEVDLQVFLAGLTAASWGVYDILIRFNTDQPIEGKKE